MCSILLALVVVVSCMIFFNDLFATFFVLAARQLVPVPWKMCINVYLNWELYSIVGFLIAVNYIYDFFYSSAILILNSRVLMRQSSPSLDVNASRM